jgi:hypothetical protein
MVGVSGLLVWIVRSGARVRETRGQEKSHRMMHAMAFLESLAEWTGLEPATPGVTGRYSNQLNYHSSGFGP